MTAWQLSIGEVGTAGETTGVPEAIWLLTIEPQPGADVTGACAAASPLTAIRFDSEPEAVRSGEYGMSPVRKVGRSGRRSWGVALVCLVAGVALHFGAGMAMLIAAAWTEVPGGGGQAADSVQVEIVSAEALQARGVVAVASEEKAVSEAEADEGGESTVTAAADAAQKVEDEVRPQETEPAAPPEDDVVAMRRLETSPEPERREAVERPENRNEPEQEQAPEKTPDEMVRKPAAAQTAGRNAPAGSTPAATQTMLRAASRGEIKRFNASLWKAIQRRLPRQRGLRGTVEVTFSLTQEGTVGGARVSKSSGNGALDRVALRAIRSARFAKPPTGMSEAQLVYRIPIRFR